MAVKFLIISADTNEQDYCKRVCKLVDNTLVDGDFAFITSDNLTASLDAAKITYAAYAIKPFVIYPYGAEESHVQKAFEEYPDWLIGIGFVHSPVFPSNAPISFTYVSTLLTAPDKVTPAVLVSGGQSGLADWNTGAGLEFVEPAHIMYVNSGTNVISFPVTSITNQGGGVARINSASLAAFAYQYWKIHITGATGLQNSPNGTHNIAAVGSDYVDIAFNVGTGTSGGTILCNVEFTSGAISGVMTKLRQIMSGRNCTIGEARQIARLTASSPTRDNTHGYGQIDVAAAIAYTGSIPADDLDALGSVTLLSGSISTAPTLVLSAPEVTNARQIYLYKDDVKIATIDMLWNEDFAYTFDTYELGTHAYKIKAVRGRAATNYSNTYSTSLTALTGLPLKAKYIKDDYVYALISGIIRKLKITSQRLVVSNPRNDSKGLQLNYCRFEEIGNEIEEAKLFASMNSLLSHIKGDYLNHEIDSNGDSLGLLWNSLHQYPSVGYTDLAGIDFDGVNFNDVILYVYKGVDIADETGLEVEYSLLGAVIDGSSFVGATLLTGQTTRAQVRAAVKSYDAETTIMPDGLPIGKP